MPARISDSTLPSTLRPYTFHGLDLHYKDGAKEALADCPWCGKEGKFSIEVKTGLWRCFSCNEGLSQNRHQPIQGGNSYSFLRLLHKYSLEQKQHIFRDGQLEGLRINRRLLYLDTLRAWGITTSLLGKDCLIPGYTDTERLTQLYRFTQIKSKKGWNYRLFATPQHGVKDGSNEEIYHTLLGLQLWDTSKDEVYVAEGLGDALALWEVLRRAKRSSDDDRLGLTANSDRSLLATANVVAVPGCTTFNKDWSKWFKDKIVYLLFDNDHPRLNDGGRDLGRAGFRGMQRVARALKASATPPANIYYLHWGDNGFNADLADGYDVRDCLAPQADTPLARRVVHLQELLGKLKEVPDQWLDGVKPEKVRTGSNGLTPSDCTTWKRLEEEWRKALRWRQGLADCLATLLAVCTSTDQVGSQLFLQFLGQAGSSKTRMCEALLTSPYCYAVEKIKGFHSGFKGGKDDQGQSVDYSLIDRCNHKTLITAEGDLLMSSPNAEEFLAEARRFFDGSTSNSYKNQAEDRHYHGRRTPWIIAGTPALMNRCQSHLGDRFLRIMIDHPSSDEQREILWYAAHAADRNTLQISNGSPDSVYAKETQAAYEATGGYVNFLRDHVSELLAKIETPKWALGRCISLAQFVAYLRSRPDPNPLSEVACREEATRLTEQFVKLAKNLAAVLNKIMVDEEVMRIVHKVAIDSSQGRTLDICRNLYQAGRNAGIRLFCLAQDSGTPVKKEQPMLIFLHKIGVAEPFSYRISPNVRAEQRWRLTVTMHKLWQEVIVGKGTARVAAMKD